MHATIKRLIFYFLFLSALTQAVLVTVSAQDSQRVSRTISARDLDEPCPAKFLEIHVMANNDAEAGTAVLKLFYLDT